MVGGVLPRIIRAGGGYQKEEEKEEVEKVFWKMHGYWFSGRSLGPVQFEELVAAKAKGCPVNVSKSRGAWFRKH
ncbi:hypothetical protein GCM10011405_27880 [Rufibacter glacialis]|nr:hypothetical protein GCM10011405_27880 [Rufibacter glacialis]